MVITICGSSRFKDEILQVAQKLTMDNHIVLAPFIFHHADDIELSTEQKLYLDNLHKQKINMSDAIYVVNVDGYIGESTWSEIDWAQRMNKEVYFLVNPTPEESEEQNTEEAAEAEISTEE